MASWAEREPITASLSPKARKEILAILKKMNYPPLEDNGWKKQIKDWLTVLIIYGPKLGV